MFADHNTLSTDIFYQLVSYSVGFGINLGTLWLAAHTIEPDA